MEHSQRDNKAYYTENSSRTSARRKEPGSEDGNNEDRTGASIFTSKAPGGAHPSRRDVVADNGSFDFERSKIQQLQLEPAQQVVDINDESICKLRREILERFQIILIVFERNSGVIRIMSVILLFLDILEMIGMFFLLLLMSLKMVPSEQILLWIGMALIMCLLQMYMLIKVIGATQSKDSRDHRDYICASVWFFLSCILVLSLAGCNAIFDLDLFMKSLKREAKTTLRAAQKVLLVTTALKFACQVVFVVLEVKQMNNLAKMAGDDVPQLDTLPSNSPHLVLVKNQKQ